MRSFPFIVASAAALATFDEGDVSRPLNKVITLLQGMSNQVTADVKADEELHKKMSCWCKTNREAKSASVKAFMEKIDALEAEILEHTAMIKKLKTEIKHLEQDIEKFQEALATATKIRSDQKADFEAEEKDLMQTLESLKGAIVALKSLNKPAAAFLQLQSVAGSRGGGKFGDIMRKDLWDVLGAMQQSDEKEVTAKDLMAQLNEKKNFLQQPVVRDYTKAQAADESGVTGNAGGVKSYNSRSGRIFGILEQMEETFSKNLGMARSNEANAVKTFKHLKAAKLAEIAAAEDTKKLKKKTLGDTSGKKAAAEKDLGNTEESLSADQKFVITMEKKCKHAEETFHERQASRAAELESIHEAITILSNDESRAQFHKTYNNPASQFYQVSSGTAEEQRLRHRAADKLMSVAKKQGNTVLASVAMSAKLDTFTKVKEVLATLLADLKQQQEAERKKKDECNESLFVNKDTTMDKKKALADTEATIAELEANMKKLADEIEVAKTVIKDSQTEMQVAGHNRADENKAYQEVVKNNRLTVNVLEKAITALAAFYEKEATAGKPALLQAEPRAGESVVGYAPPTAKEAGTAYEKNQNATGAVALLEGIKADTEAMTKEAEKDEQEAQASYEAFMQDSNSVIKSAAKAINQKTAEKAQTETDHASTGTQKEGLEADVTTLGEEKADIHEDCDFVLNNYDVRQSSREEEMDAIAQAQAVLSGADFAL